MMTKGTNTIEIDGASVQSLTNFCKQLAEAVNGKGSYYGDSYDFIRDLLAKQSSCTHCTLVILNSDQLEHHFGDDQTLYEANRKYGTATGVPFEKQRDDLADAVNGVAPTVYQRLIETITEVEGVQLELA
jgi:hypothetical protein